MKTKLTPKTKPNDCINVTFDSNGDITKDEEIGLTKREYTAIQLAAGMLGNSSTTKLYSREDLMQTAVLLTDILITNLNKPKP